MKGRITRQVKYEAEDPKVGMTALELMTVCAQAVPGMVPKVEIGLNGRIKAIKLEVEFRAE